MLNIVRHEMNVICPADNIPKAIEVDVSKLDINGTLHLSDLNLPAGVKVLIRGRDVTICSIVAPTSVIEEQKAAAAAAAAPVVEAAPAEGARLPPVRWPAGAAPGKPGCTAGPWALAPARSNHAPERALGSLQWPTRRFLSLGWAILARNMPSIATMPVSFWWTPFTPNIALVPGGPNSKA